MNVSILGFGLVVFSALGCLAETQVDSAVTEKDAPPHVSVTTLAPLVEDNQPENQQNIPSTPVNTTVTPPVEEVLPETSGPTETPASPEKIEGENQLRSGYHQAKPVRQKLKTTTTRQPKVQKRPGSPTPRPLKKPERPIGKPLGRPFGRPPGRPDGSPDGRPAERPAKRPAWRPAGRPSGRPDGRPAGRPNERPSGRWASHRTEFRPFPNEPPKPQTRTCCKPCLTGICNKMCVPIPCEETGQRPGNPMKPFNSFEDSFVPSSYAAGEYTANGVFVDQTFCCKIGGGSSSSECEVIPCTKGDPTPSFTISGFQPHVPSRNDQYRETRGFRGSLGILRSPF